MDLVESALLTRLETVSGMNPRNCFALLSLPRTPKLYHTS